MALTDHGSELDVRYPALALHVPCVRRAVSTVATRCGADAAALMRIELAVSEAATNVVLHAYRSAGSAGEMQVTARADGDVLVVGVRDAGVGMSPHAASPGLGLGLSLIAHEADHCDVRAAANGGTEILMRFEICARPTWGHPPHADHAGAAATA